MDVRAAGMMAQAFAGLPQRAVGQLGGFTGVGIGHGAFTGGGLLEGRGYSRGGGAQGPEGHVEGDVGRLGDHVREVSPPNEGASPAPALEVVASACREDTVPLLVGC